MYKQYITLLLAGLIGISTGLSGAEMVPATPAEFVKTAEIAPKTSPADMVVTITAADGKEVPLLINLDQDLYKQYCQSYQNRYADTRNSKVIMLAIAGVIIAMQVNALVSFPYSESFSACKSVLGGWWSLPAFKKLARFVKVGIPTAIFSLAWKGFQAYSFTSLVSNSIQNLTTLGTDMNSINLWEERELLPDTQKQALWHQEIYALFGNPEVIGTFPVTGKYKLRGYKSYGVGHAIFGPFEFDPFDREQVKTLLGLGSIRQDLRCSKIEIIVL